MNDHDHADTDGPDNCPGSGYTDDGPEDERRENERDRRREKMGEPEDIHDDDTELDESFL